MRLEGSWSDLERRGFVVIRSLCSPSEILAQRDTFLALSQESWRLTGYSIPLEQDAEAPLRARLLEVLPQIQSATGLRVDSVRAGGQYFTTQAPAVWGAAPRPVIHEWHTDRSSYYLHQDHYHFLNFWIPIIKTTGDKSGLLMIPMDSLAQCSPAAFQVLKGRGAAEICGDRLIYELDDRTYAVPCPFEPRRLAVAPPVNPGDAIVVRGDVLHRTQDASTYRVAISLRAYNSEQVLTKRTLFTMSPRKFGHMMRKARGIRRSFAELIATFWYHRAPHITYRQLETMREDLRKRRLRAVAVFLAARTLYPVAMRWHYRRSKAQP